MTEIIHYQDASLHIEDVALTEVAKQFGTPCYVYSQTAIEQRWSLYQAALQELDHLICYAVKANSNIAILQLLARLGAGFDIVSSGELARVLKAGADPKKIVFSGVGKRSDEIQEALQAGIHCFNVESVEELKRIQTIAKQCNKIAPISLRVNPDVDPKTHPYIATGLKESKFGIDIGMAEAVYQQAEGYSHLEIKGIDCHIGSQLLDIEPIFEALDKVLNLLDRLQSKGITVTHIDMGGGLGICYQNEQEPALTDFGQRIAKTLAGRNLCLILEPGRSMVGNAGVLLTRVEHIKPSQDKKYAIVDAAMNDLARPSLYDAWHGVQEVELNSDLHEQDYDIVGPVCESGDFLAKSRSLRIDEGHLLAIASVGAYGFVMSSNYNSRPRPPEIIVKGSQMHLIRQRESINDLMKGELLLSD